MSAFITTARRINKYPVIKVLYWALSSNNSNVTTCDRDCRGRMMTDLLRVKCRRWPVSNGFRDRPPLPCHCHILPYPAAMATSRDSYATNFRDHPREQ